MRIITADCAPIFMGSIRIDRFLHLCVLFRFVMLSVASAEFFDAACGIHKLLFSGKERVTGGTYFHFKFGQNRSDLECASTGTGRCDYLIFRVYIFFHRIREPPLWYLSITQIIQAKISNISSIAGKARQIRPYAEGRVAF